MTYPAIEKLIRDVPDFPKPGIIFKDMTPVLLDPDAMAEIVAALHDWAAPLDPDVIVGIESRGFIFGTPLALSLRRGFIPVRKVGKLPSSVLRETYDLEYGTNSIEIHEDALSTGQRVLVIDDLLATGGTAAAAGRLIERLGCTVAGYGFVMELAFLSGRSVLGDVPIKSLVHVE
jgi:adenine phosphoribosyltransferase